MIVALVVTVESCTKDDREIEDRKTKDSQTASKEKYNNELRSELIQMLKEDQEIREKTRQANYADSVLNEQAIEIDRKNTARMQEIVQKYGWPGKSLVGEGGSNAAGFLVLHADLEYEFQKQCLKLMEKAAKKGEVSMKLVAYLTDRVLVAEGKKQIYGTQFETKNGKLVPSPIEDEINIDKRRKEVGLPPLEEYKKMMNESH